MLLITQWRSVNGRTGVQVRGVHMHSSHVPSTHATTKLRYDSYSTQHSSVHVYGAAFVAVHMLHAQ